MAIIHRLTSIHDLSPYSNCIGLHLWSTLPDWTCGSGRIARIIELLVWRSANLKSGQVGLLGFRGIL